MAAKCSRRASARRCASGGERRQPAGRRVHHQRGAVVEVPVDHPELVVVSGRAVSVLERVLVADRRGEDTVAERGVAVSRAEDLRVTLPGPGQLLLRQLGLVAQRLRALQRRRGVVRPDPLQVGPAVSRAGQHPRFGLGGLRETGAGRQRESGRQDANHEDRCSQAHCTPAASLARAPASMFGRA